MRGRGIPHASMKYLWYISCNEIKEGSHRTNAAKGEKVVQEGLEDDIKSNAVLKYQHCGLIKHFCWRIIFFTIFWRYLKQEIIFCLWNTNLNKFVIYQKMLPSCFVNLLCFSMSLQIFFVRIYSARIMMNFFNENLWEMYSKYFWFKI